MRKAQDILRDRDITVEDILEWSCFKQILKQRCAYFLQEFGKFHKKFRNVLLVILVSRISRISKALQ